MEVLMNVYRLLQIKELDLPFSPFVINPPMNLATNGRPAAKNTWTFPWSENQVLSSTSCLFVGLSVCV